MKLIADYYKPDLFLSPLGGHFVMDPKEAALATNLIHTKFAFPMHYATAWLAPWLRSLDCKRIDRWTSTDEDRRFGCCCTAAGSAAA